MSEKRAFHIPHKSKKQHTRCTKSTACRGVHWRCTLHVLRMQYSQDTCIAFPRSRCTFGVGRCLELRCVCNGRTDSLVHNVYNSHHTSSCFAHGRCMRLHAPENFFCRCLGSPDTNSSPHEASLFKNGMRTTATKRKTLVSTKLKSHGIEDA